MKYIFKSPIIRPVITATTRDFSNSFVNASLFEKSTSNNPNTNAPANSPAEIDKNVTLKEKSIHNIFGLVKYIFS